MNDLSDVADLLRKLRHEAGLSQSVLASRAGVSRVTVARMETASMGDMSVSALLRLLNALGYEVDARRAGHQRTLEDILADQRSGRDGSNA